MSPSIENPPVDTSLCLSRRRSDKPVHDIREAI